MTHGREYLVLAPSLSHALAFGTIRPSTPLKRSRYDNPDFWGGAMDWLSQAASGAGDYLDNLISKDRTSRMTAEDIEMSNYVDEIQRSARASSSTKMVTSVSSTHSSPLYDALGNVLPAVGEWAMQSPLGSVLTGIGKGAVDAASDPLGAVQSLLGSYNPFDPFGINRRMNELGSKDETKYDDPSSAEPDGSGDRSYGKNGATSGQPGGQAQDTEVITDEDGNITNVYNYYYDPNAAQVQQKNSDDGLFGGGAGNIMMIMMLMSMMMPMMGGFGGLPQVIKAEPRQRDVSGLFYG